MTQGLDWLYMHFSIELATKSDVTGTFFYSLFYLFCRGAAVSRCLQYQTSNGSNAPATSCFTNTFVEGWGGAHRAWADAYEILYLMIFIIFFLSFGRRTLNLFLLLPRVANDPCT